LRPEKLDFFPFFGFKTETFSSCFSLKEETKGRIELTQLNRHKGKRADRREKGRFAGFGVMLIINQKNGRGICQVKMIQ
jgi:hypothetical protein